MTDLSDVLHSVYDTVLAPESWEVVLPRLGTLFNCHFADVFSRRTDWSRYQGMAIGLEEDDYQETFLGIWTKRNVWAERHPVAHAGEVVATTDFIARAEVERSDMYTDYLRHRDLHQGLRLSTWCGEGWINDVSLIRSWSAGEFTAEERRLAHWLIPHLRRAVAMAHAVRPASLFFDGADQLERLDVPAVVVAADGTLLRHNPAAEQLARESGLLAIAGAHSGLKRVDFHEGLLEAAIAGAGQPERPIAATLRLRDRAGQLYKLLVIPIGARRIWPIPAQSAVLLLAFAVDEPAVLSAGELSNRYGLTPTEAAVALHLATGATVTTIAAQIGRSSNTVRTHVNRILNKTDLHRQADLVRLILGNAPAPLRPLGDQPVISVDPPG